MNYNIKGLKYFIYNITKNKNNYLELPEDIRRLIWKFAHDYYYLECYLCNKVLITFKINIMNNINDNENFLIMNGITKCNDCIL